MFDFIKHDTNASSDPKIMRLRMKHKSAGYGVFWLILEKLAINGGELETDFNTLGYEFRESAELVKSVVSDFDLFVFSPDNKRFSSVRLMKSIEEMQKKSNKAREAINKRWEKIRTKNDCNTNVLLQNNNSNSNVIQNRIEENRIEENRIEENRINISPSKNDGGECVQHLLLPSEAKKEVKSSKAEQLQLEADFDFFWKIYPRHVSKKDSLRAYIKARKKASADELLEALREVKSKEWRSKELQYIPHASTWLNQERWTDEVTEAKKIDPLDDLDLESNPFEVSK